MHKSSRALGAATMLAMLVGSSHSVLAQSPPEAGALSGVYGPQPGMMPGGPMIMPGPGMPPGGEPILPDGSILPEEAIGGSGGAHGPKAWFGAEALLYWTKHAPVPFVAVSVGQPGTNGALGSPGVRPYFGNTEIGLSTFAGIRTFGGIWLTNNESFGIEGNFFILPSKQSGTPALTGTQGYPVLARPFYDTANNRQSARIVSSPGLFAGTVQTTAGIELWGAELGPVWRAIDTGRWTFDVLSAFKFLDLNETLSITDIAHTQAGGVSVLQGRAYNSPSTLTVSDEFRTQNNFYGGTIGARSNLHVEAFTWSLTGKIAFGNMHSTLTTTGTSTVSSAAMPPLTSAGGFYAAGPNLGTFSQDQFAVIPELLANMNVQITSHIAVNFGYNYLYVSRVLLPGNQITGQMNPNAIPTSPNFGAHSGPTGTNIPLATSNFWAQGFNFGVSVGY